jgi:hypothetical protein
MGAIALSAGGWQVLALQAEQEGLSAPAVVANLDADSIPKQLGSWSQTGYEMEHRKKNSILGDVSKIWTYQSHPFAAMVSVDYPFRGWHGLGVCYQGQGWNIDEYRSIPLGTADAVQRTQITEVKMQRPTGERALLLFALINRHGHPLQDPAIGSAGLQWTRRVVERLKRPFAQQFPELDPDFGVTTQLQLLIVSDDEVIPPAVEESAREQFAALQTQIAGLLASESASVSEGETP